MGERRPAFPPALAVAIAVVSVSFAAPLFRFAQAPAVTASFWRLAFAVALLAPFSRPALPAWRAYSARAWAVTALAGLALAAHFALWVTSLGMTTVAAATVLVTMQAVFVAVGASFLGDRLAPVAWVGVGVAVLGGVALAVTDAGRPGGSANPPGTTLLGDLLALAAGGASAVYFLVGRRVRAGRGLLEYVVPVYTVAALALLLALPFVGQPLWPAPAAAGGGVASMAWLRPFVLFVVLAAVPMLGGHTMSNYALRHLGAATVATWILLEPVGAALLAWPLFGEIPGSWTYFGGAMILAGAALTMVRPRGVDPGTVASEPAG